MWWLRSRASLGAAVMVVASTVGMARIGLNEMPLPRIVVGVAPFFIFLPAFVGTALIWVVDRGHHLAEARSGRAMSWASGAALVVLVGIVCAAWVILLMPAWGESLTWQAIRSVLGYCGVALVAHRYFGGRIGAAAPILYAVAVAVMGRDRGGVGWWPLLDASRRDAWLLVGGLCCMGVVMATTRRARYVQWERTLLD